MQKLRVLKRIYEFNKKKGIPVENIRFKASDYDPLKSNRKSLFGSGNDMSSVIKQKIRSVIGDNMKKRIAEKAK